MAKKSRGKDHPSTSLSTATATTSTASNNMVTAITYTDAGIEIRQASVSRKEIAMMRVKGLCMDIIKARKHNAGYPQGYDGEEIVTPFEERVHLLKLLVDLPMHNTSGWDKPEAVALAALKTRLRFMQDGDRFTSGDVVLISKVLERMGTLNEVGLVEWAKEPCNNPVCKEHASSKKGETEKGNGTKK